MFHRYLFIVFLFISSLSIAQENELLVFGKEKYYNALDQPIIGGHFQTRIFSLIKADSTLVLWGDNGQAQIEVPRNINKILDVKLGESYVLVLNPDSTLNLWGTDPFNKGILNLPNNVSNVKMMASGSYHCLALTEQGKLIGWGDNSHGQLNILNSSSTFTKIYANHYHLSCGITADSTIEVYGNENSSPNFEFIEIINSPNNIKEVALSSNTVYALTSKGKVYRWGNSISGDSVITDLSNVKSIYSGYGRVSAITEDGKFYSTISAQLPEKLKDSVNIIRDIIYEYYRKGMITKNGVYYQWSSNFKLYNQDIPHVISGIDKLECGEDYHNNIVVLKKNNSIDQWGSSYADHEIFFDEKYNVLDVSFGRKLLKIISGDTVLSFNSNSFSGDIDTNIVIGARRLSERNNTHFMVIKGDSTIETFGYKNNIYNYGELKTPFNIKNVKQAIAFNNSSIVLKSDGTIQSWGKPLNFPENLYDVEQIAVGEDHFLTLKKDGTVIGWGENEFGQIDIPDNLDHVKMIAAGNGFSIALRIDGSVVAWGKNDYNQISFPLDLPVIKLIAARGDISALAIGDENDVEEIPSTLANSNYSSIEKNLSIYPNPVKGTLNIHFQHKKFSNYRIMNSSGQLLKTGIIVDSHQLELDLSDFNSGLYVLRLEGENEIVSKKFTKE